MSHWTKENDVAFAHKLGFDFIAQIEKRLESSGVSQKELARLCGVSEGAVSKVLNNPQNLTLKTIAKYAQALGIKTAIVAYDDGDPGNENGLINSEIFTTCWEHAGRPRDVWAVDMNQAQHGSTEEVIRLPYTFLNLEGYSTSWVVSYINPIATIGYFDALNAKRSTDAGILTNVFLPEHENAGEHSNA